MRARFWVAILVTPLVVSLIALVLTPFLMHVGIFWAIGYPAVVHGGTRPSDLTIATQIQNFSMPLAYSYVATAMLGAPTLLFLRWRRIDGWLGFMMAGFLVATITAFAGTILFAFGDSGTPFGLENLERIVVALATHDVRLTQMFVAPPAMYGALTGLIFWLISRPDLEAAGSNLTSRVDSH